MKNLTDRQQEILSFIETHISDTGFPPTRAEICQALGFRSPNAAEEHLKALVRKGAISMVAGASRSIRLLEDTVQNGLQSLRLPLIGRVAAGSPILATEHIESHHSLDAGLFKSQPDYLLKVRGMSMRDAGILDGDLLAVQKLRAGQAVRNGQLVVARVEDEVTVKWFEQKGSLITLRPDNPEFKPIVVNADKQAIALEGLGVGVIRRV